MERHGQSHFDVLVAILLLEQTYSTGSLPRGGDVAVYVKDIKQPSLPTSCYSVLISISVFMAL